jgi:hypothetical protein
MKWIFAVAILILLLGISAHGASVNVQGKWSIVFSSDSGYKNPAATISQSQVNILQNVTTAALSSPNWSGLVGGTFYSNSEARTDSVCSTSGWSPISANNGLNGNGHGGFLFHLYTDPGVSYTLTGTVDGDGQTIAGTFTSNCQGDSGYFKAQRVLAANISASLIINGFDENGGTQYQATFKLAEDSAFNVTGSLQLLTTAGQPTCLDTIQFITSPATGSTIELGNALTDANQIGILIQSSNDADFTTFTVATFVSSGACREDPGYGTYSKSNKSNHSLSNPTYATLVADSFAGDDVSPLPNPPWSVDGGIAPLQRKSDSAELTSLTESIGIYTGIVFPRDDWAQVVVKACADQNDSALLVMHRQDALNGYALEVDGPLGKNANVDLFSLVNAQVANIIFTGTLTVNPNDVIRMEVYVDPNTGQQIVSGFINGKIFASGVDNTFAGGSVALDAFGDTASSNVQFTNFSAGSISFHSKRRKQCLCWVHSDLPSPGLGLNSFDDSFRICDRVRKRRDVGEGVSQNGCQLSRSKD